MCAINGFNFKNEELIQKMNHTTKHRGPDADGIFLDEKISLGHNRLSIIDLSPRGAQPMKNRRGNLTIIFNGEIYNYQELKKDLDYVWQSDSDTEVILAMYEKYGPHAMKHFNGIFSLAIWNSDTQELFVARDHAGVKPLHYYFDGKIFIFSSEINGILEHHIKREVNDEAFQLYMRLLYVPEPMTMFKNIFKFPAGSYGILRGNNFTITKFWEITDFKNLTDYIEVKEKIKATALDAVRVQLISDRPVGVFLSGGIDSTAVLGMYRKLTKEKIKTYSVGFSGGLPKEEEKFNADFLLARQTAKKWGTDHHELMISGRDIKDNLEKIITHLGEPVANATAGAMYLLSREAKKQVAVVLGGDGGDELFGGYPRYRAAQMLPFLDLRWRLSAQKEAVVQSILNKKSSHSRLIYSSPKTDVAKAFMHFDFTHWLRDESLLRTDRMTAANGLEARVPILDYRLAELAFKVPTNWKIPLGSMFKKNFQGKHIWIEAMREYLPDHILGQRKRGWFSPTAKWLRGDLKPLGEQIISNLLNEDYFDKKAVQQMWADHQSTARYNMNLLWAIITWQLWYNIFIKRSV